MALWQASGATGRRGAAVPVLAAVGAWGPPERQWPAWRRSRASPTRSLGGADRPEGGRSTRGGRPEATRPDASGRPDGPIPEGLARGGDDGPRWWRPARGGRPPKLRPEVGGPTGPRSNACERPARGRAWERPARGWPLAVAGRLGQARRGTIGGSAKAPVLAVRALWVVVWSGGPGVSPGWCFRPVGWVFCGGVRVVGRPGWGRPSWC